MPLSAATATDVVAAEKFLARRDPVMKKLIATYKPSIISQQLSAKAADTIQKRVMLLVGAKKNFKPPHIIGCVHDDLRASGLSHAKARWLRTLAEQVHDGTFSFTKLKRMDDAAAIEALDALPGIGRWTAEMYLIFALHRLDIFAMGDVGLRNCINKLYNDGEALNEEETLIITDRWAPYRSVASWYLWRVVDGDIANFK